MGDLLAYAAPSGLLLEPREIFISSLISQAKCVTSQLADCLAASLLPCTGR